MPLRHRALVASLLLLAACAQVPALPPAPKGTPAALTPEQLMDAGRPGLAAITGGALSARIRFLSSDLLEGRFTGSRGHAIAEQYVASELQAAGFEPLGANGSFVLPVPLRAALRDRARTSLSFGAPGQPSGAFEALADEAEFILGSDLRTAEIDVRAPLVFVGYGVVAPEYGWDDLAGADLRGKIAVVLSNAPLSERPDFFPSTAHALYSDVRAKVQRLAAAGAVGVLSVFTPEQEERLPWARVGPASRIEQMGWLEGSEPATSPKGAPLRGALHWKAFERLLAKAGVAGGLAGLQASVNARTAKPLPLAVEVHGKVSCALRDLTSGNVAGILRGSDPKLSAQAIVYSAHLDHLGIGAPVDGDTLYNGALDNASGSAAVLEVARAFAALQQRPARSVIALFVTGEERGMLGSERFARHPPLPQAAALVADINLDMLVSLAPLVDATGLGMEHSTLEAHARAAGSALGVLLSLDPEPKQVHFIRSDQYRFVQRGIPSIALYPGLKGKDEAATAALKEKRRAWIQTRYHSPKDKWDPSYDYEAMAQVARLAFLTGLSVAWTEAPPRWYEGDLFARFPLD